MSSTTFRPIANALAKHPVASKIQTNNSRRLAYTLTAQKRGPLSPACQKICTGYYTALTILAVAQWVRALDSQAEGWGFELELRRTTVVKIVNDSPTAERLSIGVSVIGPQRRPL